MSIATIVVSFRPIELDRDEAYQRFTGLLGSLSAIHTDFDQWWLSPRSAREKLVAFSDREVLYRRWDEEQRAQPAESPGAGVSNVIGFLVTNAGDEKLWKKRGRVSLGYFPARGQLRLQVATLEDVFRDPSAVLWEAMKAIVEFAKPLRAWTDWQQRVGDDLLIYSMDRAPFQHRQFLGWMGYVPSALTAEQVPEAERLERSGSGTLILATKLLDLGNPAAIKQANQVEMRLADLDLLPVLDDALR